MTDNEIIKALECCKEYPREVKCEYCVAFADCKCTLTTSEVLDLINRQRQELEMLGYSLESMLFEVKNAHELRDGAITNAIKYFAERLKNKLTACSKTIDGECEYLICDCDIDNLVKEMLAEKM